MSDYIKAGTTYSIAPKPEVLDLISVEVGDSKQREFHPQTKIMRWNNEVNLSFRLVHNETEPTVNTNDGKIQWRGERQSIDFYEIAPDQDHPEGATEIEVILYERPIKDRVQFTINAKGVDFLYQPPLSLAEIQAGAVRPEHIVGSWAIYASERKVNYQGETLYRAGKVGHLYNSLMIDAVGHSARTNPYIDLNGDGTGTLTINLDKGFLDKAVYPIRHAAGATIGYTTQGASGTAWSGGFLTGTKDELISSQEGAVLNSISQYRTSSNGTNARLGVYSFPDSSYGTGTLVGETAEISDGATGWITTNITGSPTLPADLYYLITWLSSGNWSIAYDSVASASRYVSQSYGALPSSISGLTTYGWKFSIYATYTPVSSPSTNFFLMF